MKTKEKLNVFKEEAEKRDQKFRELADDELEQVSGGGTVHFAKAGEVFYTGELFFVHIKDIGQIITFTDSNEAINYIDSLDYKYKK